MPGNIPIATGIKYRHSLLKSQRDEPESQSFAHKSLKIAAKTPPEIPGRINPGDDDSPDNSCNP